MSDWSNTIKYINSFPNDNYRFSPKQVKEYIYGNSDTIGLYINYLHKAMYLKRMGHGIYRRIRLIPKDLTLSKLRSFVYPIGKTWEERKGMVERYWKLQNIKEKI